jgi:hypothetical protein
MPNITALIASGLSALVAVPMLAIAGTGGATTTCLPVPTGNETTVAAQAVAGPPSSPGWDADQVAIAATILTVGQARGVPAWGWVVAVATAMQESQLRNLPGGDADSIGVFQQRPSQGWGTPAQLASPTYRAGKFYDALLAIPRWQAMPLTQAANKVQRSAFPSRYARWTSAATVLVAQLTSTPSATASAAGGPVGIPTSGCTTGQDVLARAATWLTAWNGGPVPYSMSTDPASFFQGYRRDCSGYASMALGLPGPGLNTAGLAARATPITKADLKPGDLLINPAPGGAGHVVIFDHWTDATLTHYLAYEQSGDGGTHHRVLPYPYPGNYPLSPYRLH